MEIKQKKGRNTHTFRFERDHFNFAYEDKRGSGDADFRYIDLPKNSSTVIEYNEWLRNVGLLWCAIAALQIGYALYHGESRGSIWLILGLACIAIAHFTKIRYTVFRFDDGRVFVIQNKDHDAVIAELNLRRTDQFRRWYGEVNSEVDKEIEIKKFNWLREEGILSPLEADEKIAEVILLHEDKSVTKPSEFN